MLNEFAALLKITDPRVLGNESKLVKRVNTRLIGIGLGAVCGRCGGSGHYSFNMMDGTRCYGCGGSGYVIRKLTKDLLGRAAEAVEAGKLDEYLEGLRIKAVVNKATDIVMKAWKDTGISDLYDWRLSADFHRDPSRTDLAEHGRISDLNKIMCDEYDAVRKMAEEYRSTCWKLDNRKVKPEYLDEVKARKVRLESELPGRVEAAVAKIKETATLI